MKMPFDLERKDMGSMDIEKIRKREFASNEFMVGFDKGIMNQAAGSVKAGQWKNHFEKLRRIIKK